jgi:hypothetical protein
MLETSSATDTFGRPWLQYVLHTSLRVSAPRSVRKIRGITPPAASAVVYCLRTETAERADTR